MTGFDLYFESESFDYRKREDDSSISKRLDELNKVLEQAKELGDALYKEFGIYDIEFLPDAPMGNWLYGTTSDWEAERKLLRGHIEKSRTVDEDTYQTVKSAIDSVGFVDGKAFLSLANDSGIMWYIKDSNNWQEANRYYLHRANNIPDFMEDMERCFPNLHVRPEVARTLRTLEYPFADYQREIIQHLANINDYFSSIREEFSGYGNEEVAQRFQSTTGIECSPENDRDTASRRTFEFINNQGQYETICCELHTRLKTFRRDKDRLYFHPGKSHIQDGKILVGFIGRHGD